MPNVHNLQNNYGESYPNLVHEVNWNQTDNDSMVYQKVNQWLMLYKETQPQTDTPENDFFDTIPELIPKSPVFKRRKYDLHTSPTPNQQLFDSTSSLSKPKDPENLKPNHFPSPKTPPTKHNSDLTAEVTSPIVRRKSYTLRKRKLFQDLDSKHEISSSLSRTTNQNSFAFSSKVDNSQSPVLISKRYSFRKKERSFVISELSQISDTVPVKIEEDESPSVKDCLELEPNSPFHPVAAFTQKIDLIESEDEEGDKENVAVQIDSVSLEEVGSVKEDGIEDIYTQDTSEKVLFNSSKNSDDTYCSVMERKIHPATQSSHGVSETKVETGFSGRISQNSSASVAGRTLPNESVLNLLYSSGENGTKFNFSTTSVRKKKKVQKNSLSDKLSKLIGTAASFNRMWYYQISRHQIQQCYSKFALLNIKNTYPFNGRQVIECQVVKDEENLLLAALGTRCENITVITVPEIVGSITIPNRSYMKLFPPLKVIDGESRLFEALHFVFEEKREESICTNSTEIVEESKVEKFECPCLENGSIVEHCDKRFTDCKPCVIDEILE